MRLILMGTGPFALPAFDALRASGHDIAAVITRPAPPVKSRKGPPPQPVRDWAESQGFSVHAPDSINTKEAIDFLQSLHAELQVVCDYGQILSDTALETTILGGINLHGSLLPRYRGAAPVQRALLAGDEMTGVSVIHMTPRLDGGPLLATAETAIRTDETAGDLEARLSLLGVKPTLDAVRLLSEWDRKSTIGEMQDPGMVTKAPRLSKKEAAINWGRTNSEIDCLIRGMQPWPIAFCHLPLPNGKAPLRLAVKKVRALSSHELTSIVSEHQEMNRLLEDATVDPGTILTKKQLVVKTGSGAIEIVRIQPAGKKDMSGTDFLRGHQPPFGTRLS